MFRNYDIIGDIHGYGDDLERLLRKLGYRPLGSSFAHPTRKALFVGDLIDRGPGIHQVLKTVRAMVEAGSAQAVLGNHEFNAVAFSSPDLSRPGAFLRAHTSKNTAQYQATLNQVPERELAGYLAWFRTLPFYLDLGTLRIVHACWDAAQMAVVQAGTERFGHMTPEFLQAALTPSPLMDATEVILKGREMPLPKGASYLDKDGNKRKKFRTKWYQPVESRSYADYAFPSDPALPAATIQEDLCLGGYPKDAPPVFIGHYWMKGKEPAVLADNVACVDYSVAAGGYLCCYRWDGEEKLENSKFVWA